MDFDEELKRGFLEEAEQAIADTEQCFLLLEADPTDTPTLEKIFRLAHNLKGSSRAVGFEAMGAFTHAFESFLIKCKSGELAINPATVSLMLKCTDQVSAFVVALKENLEAEVDASPLAEEIRLFNPATAAQHLPNAGTAQREGESEGDDDENGNDDGDSGDNDDEDVAFGPGAQPQLEDFITLEDIQVLTGSGPQAYVPPAVVATPVAAATALASVASVAAIPAAPVAAVGLAAPSRVPTSSEASSPADESIRVSLSRLERLLNFVGELVILETVLKEQSQAGNPQLLRRTIHQMGKVTKEVQDLAMGLRMVPLRQTFQKMQRIVRDTSAALGKKVHLTLAGEDTEVDKLVLEALGDPLVHLVRNAVDHGIESPAKRLAQGKPEVGNLTLKSYHQSGRLVIEVSDDGAGICADHLRERATERGILRPEQRISDADAIGLIFYPGFSTKTQVTEVSGRGVGMDVVKTNIEHLQGDVRVDTVVGRGSVFKVVLPLTLAIIDGMVVRCGQERFILPLSHVHESVKTLPQDIHTVTGVGEVLMLRGENLPVMHLDAALGRKPAAPAPTHQIAIIVRAQGKPFAALVDDIVGQHQVVVKKLGAELQHMPGISGTAILGDGKPALILELADLATARSKNKQRASKVA